MEWYEYIFSSMYYTEIYNIHILFSMLCISMLIFFNASFVCVYVCVGQQTDSGDRVCVRGDNAAVSLDSRQFGCFSSDSIVGTPLLRVFPLDRFGLLK